jgi:hypothetical protein
MQRNVGSKLRRVLGNKHHPYVEHKGKMPAPSNALRLYQRFLNITNKLLDFAQALLSQFNVF